MRLLELLVDGVNPMKSLSLDDLLLTLKVSSSTAVASQVKLTMELSAVFIDTGSTVNVTSVKCLSGQNCKQHWHLLAQ